VHGIDRRTQDHLCGAPNGIGTDALAPAMPITCQPCHSTSPTHRDGDCWLCQHPCWGALCSSCGCLAHYPPWPATTQAAEKEWFESDDGHGYRYQYIGPIHYLCECGQYFLNRERWLAHKSAEVDR
jgi:hypothetical protein